MDRSARVLLFKAQSEMAPAKTTTPSTVPNSRTPSVSENRPGCPGTCLRNHIMINEMRKGASDHDGYARRDGEARRKNDAERGQHLEAERGKTSST